MSFNDNLVRVGDRVVVKMDPEARHWRGGLPDGTLGYVIGRNVYHTYEGRCGNGLHFRKPGLYSAEGTALIVWDGTNKAVPGGYDYDFADRNLYDERVKYYRSFDLGERNNCCIARGDHFSKMTRIADLPDTQFWEDDIIRYTGDDFKKMPKLLRVHHVNWGWDKDDRGWCYGVEWIDDDGAYARCGSTNLHDNTMELVRRGNVWNEAHGEKLIFRDLAHEVQFEQLMSRYDEVRNPRTKLYSWTKEEALGAIKSGLGHGLTVGFGPLDMLSNLRISIMKLHNDEIGQRAREATMKGFGI